MHIKLVKLYIAKTFLIKFLQVTLGFSLIIFFVNFLDTVDKVKGSEATIFVTISMALLRIPVFLNEVVPSLVLIAAVLAFFILSARSEITIVRVSGLFLWQVVEPVALSAVILGIFWVSVIGPLSIEMRHKFNKLEGKYVRHEMRESVTTENGIWLKQDNIENPGEEIIIQAKKVYQDTFEFGSVTLWFFDQSGKFYKKIDAKKMLMRENFWIVEDGILNDFSSINKSISTVSILTNLKQDFIMQKIVNNFGDVQSFSIFQLPSLIEDLQVSGFSSTKFRVYLNSLLSTPLLFLAMVLIACYFGMNHIRNHNASLMIFLGVVVGLMIYIISSVASSLGASGLIPVFVSTWLVVLIFLAVGVLLIYQKDSV